MIKLQQKLFFSIGSILAFLILFFVVSNSSLFSGRLQLKDTSKSSGELNPPYRSDTTPPAGKVAADTGTPCTNLYGDINSDGKVDMFDSVCYQQFLALNGTKSPAAIPECMKISEQCADIIGCDNKISVGEALAVAQKFKFGKFNKSFDLNQNDIPDCKENPVCNNQWAYLYNADINQIGAYEVTGVWGTAADNVYFVGRQYSPDHALVMHYNGSSWKDISVPTNLFPAASKNNKLFGIWGTSSTNIYAFGYYNKIFHYDGSLWTAEGINTTGSIHAIWGSSATNIFAVGNNETILHFDGTSWNPDFFPELKNPDPAATFMSVWGSSASDIYFVGNVGSTGRLLHYDGTKLSEINLNLPPNQGQVVYSVWGSSSSNVYVGGSEGKMYHYDGKGWETLTLIPKIPLNPLVGTQHSFFSIGGTAQNDIYAMNFGGDIFHYDGNGWKDVLYDKKKPTVSSSAIWASSPANVYAGTSLGLLHYPCQP